MYSENCVLYILTLCVLIGCVFTLCVFALCVFYLCIFTIVCVSTIRDFALCVFSVCVFTLCVVTLCVSIYCVLHLYSLRSIFVLYVVPHCIVFWVFVLLCKYIVGFLCLHSFFSPFQLMYANCFYVVLLLHRAREVFAFANMFNPDSFEWASNAVFVIGCCLLIWFLLIVL